MEKRIREEKIVSTADLCDYLKTTSMSHINHKYYAPKHFIEDILHNHCLYFSNGQNWNDVIDRDSFNTEQSEIQNFGLCLSYSRSESIAMWMLYSGNDGCMIDYEKKLIEDVLSTTQIILGFFTGNGQYETIQTLSDHFEIVKTDVVYYGDSKESTNAYYVKRSDETNKTIRKGIVDNLIRCKKTIAWSYENECRIIISVPKRLIPEGVTHIKIEFDQNYVEKLKSRTYDSPNAKYNTYAKSTLAGKINWDLCMKCNRKCMNIECHERMPK